MLSKLGTGEEVARNEQDRNNSQPGSCEVTCMRVEDGGS